MPDRHGRLRPFLAALGLVVLAHLERLAQELAVGDPGVAGLGRQIARLAAQFDFDELRALARQLAGEADETS